MKEVTLTALRQKDKMINSIKALRAATGLGLRESKGLVDDLRNGVTCKVKVDDLRSISPYFTYYVHKIQLEVFVVQVTDRENIELEVVILASNKAIAEHKVDKMNIGRITNSFKLDGPFGEGRVLSIGIAYYEHKLR